MAAATRCRDPRRQPASNATSEPPQPPRVELYDFFDGVAGNGAAPRALGASHPAAVRGTFSTTLYTERALDIVRRHPAARRLFLYLACSAPHEPLLAPAEHEARARAAHEGRLGELRARYQAMLVGVDDAVGQLVATLRERRMFASSLLVFLSDNGGVAAGGGASNHPLRGGKYGAWEGGVRTVAALGGGFLPTAARGRVSATPVHISDWWATFARLAGVEAVDAPPGVPKLDSIGVWDAMMRAGGGGERLLVLSSSALLRFGRSGVAHKLLVGQQCGGWRSKWNASLGGAVAPETDEPKGACVECGDGCVFDVAADPSERHNLARSKPSLLSELRAALLDARRGAWSDPSPLNPQQPCNAVRGPDGHYREFALRHGATIQPFIPEGWVPPPLAPQPAHADEECVALRARRRLSERLPPRYTLAYRQCGNVRDPLTARASRGLCESYVAAPAGGGRGWVPCRWSERTLSCEKGPPRECYG